MEEYESEFMADYEHRKELLKLVNEWENTGKIDRLKKNECPLDMPVCVRSACPFFGITGSDMSKEGPKAQLGCKKHYLKEFVNGGFTLDNSKLVKGNGTNGARKLVKENLEYILDV